MTICLFEDDKVNQLEPLTQLHASWDLLTGTGTMATLLPQEFPDTGVVKTARPAIAGLYEDVTTELEPGDYLFINGRLLDIDALKQHISPEGEPKALWTTDGTTLVAVRLQVTETVRGDIWQYLEQVAQTVAQEQAAIRIANYLWDYIYINEEAITADAASFPLGTVKGTVHERATLIAEEQISIDEDSTIAPGVVLDATKGPILIGKGVTISANSVISGPVFLGDGCFVWPLTQIGAGFSAGQTCKLGGEISHAIMMPYSNKSHYGFLGHSYIGSWCNLGGGTSTSNMKNTYGTVSVPVQGQPVDTGELFAGLFMGDHAKTGSGMTFAPGTVIGPFSNVFGRLSAPTVIAPLQWFDTEKGAVAYALPKALEVAKRMMSRRDLTLSPGVAQTIETLAESWQGA